MQESLDPKDWEEFEKTAMEMVRDIVRFHQTMREKPVWQRPTAQALSDIRIPESGHSDLPSIYQEFKQSILPYAKGNHHPAYWAWVEGTGSPTAMMAEMLGAAMNSNCNNGDHIAMYVDQEVARWLRDSLRLPEEGVITFTSGGSLSNLTALTVARNSLDVADFRKEGVSSLRSKLIVYASIETHSCVRKSVEMLGLGSENIRYVKVNDSYQLDTIALTEQIRQDRSAGHTPFCVVANAGTVKTGAIDPLDDISEICERENLWFHVDAAFGIFARLIPEYQDSLKALNQADSIAFDLHKWMYVPYELGCVYVKKPTLLTKSFSIEADYLSVHDRGLAAGPDPLSNSGIEMSRGFRSLKVWFSIKENGVDGFRQMIGKNIRQAHYLGQRISETPNLELLAPVSMNIVCFRYNPSNGTFSNDELNELNKELLMRLHERGKVAPTYTTLNGVYAIRAAIVNHRTQIEDLDLLVKETIEIGNDILNETKQEG